MILKAKGLCAILDTKACIPYSKCRSFATLSMWSDSSVGFSMCDNKIFSTLWPLVRVNGNFVERHSFRIVLGKSPKTVQKLCLSTKFVYQEISWNYGIFCSAWTINKFEDVLSCFNWFWSNMKEQLFYICVEVELCFPWNKNLLETFQDKSQTYLTLQVIHSWPPLEGSHMASKVFSTPKWASNGGYCDPHSWLHFPISQASQITL